MSLVRRCCRCCTGDCRQCECAKYQRQCTYCISPVCLNGGACFKQVSTKKVSRILTSDGSGSSTAVEIQKTTTKTVSANRSRRGSKSHAMPSARRSVVYTTQERVSQVQAVSHQWPMITARHQTTTKAVRANRSRRGSKSHALPSARRSVVYTTQESVSHVQAVSHPLPMIPARDQTVYNETPSIAWSAPPAASPSVGYGSSTYPMTEPTKRPASSCPGMFVAKQPKVEYEQKPKDRKNDDLCRIS